MPAVFSGAYYDGRTARRHPVDLSVEEGVLLVSGAGIRRAEPLHQVRISERLGRAPRLLQFGDGAYCEVRDHAALEAALDAHGHRNGLVDRLQRSWRVAAAALLACVVIAVAAYRWGLPVAAEFAAWRLPPAVARQLSQTALAGLDRTLLQPSLLPAARKEQLSAGFAALHAPDHGADLARIEFRSSPKIGPNAFALPDGRVVLLDQLVFLAGNDQEIEGVLAHELGHVHYRHGLRMVLQGSAVALAMTAWVGDVSALLATVPTALLQTRYSREFEAQADDYAARMMLANGIPPSRLADMLERLSAQRHDRNGKGQAAKPGKPDEAEAPDYLSSHPATVERIQRLRAADAQLPAKPPAKIGG
ncbi:MAG TPA: M48 family metallopeptidase [Nevskia sp.]|nr:M48 family metallopeptidase [Nevskia sp.]